MHRLRACGREFHDRETAMAQGDSCRCVNPTPFGIGTPMPKGIVHPVDPRDQPVVGFLCAKIPDTSDATHCV
jgi:hypothetical protein